MTSPSPYQGRPKGPSSSEGVPPLLKRIESLFFPRNDDNIPLSSSTAGFTLIEVMVSIGILSIIFALGLFLSMDFYRSYAFNYEQNLVVSMLQKARSQSMANIGEMKHGACYDSVRKMYVLFEYDGVGSISDACANSPQIFKPGGGMEEPQDFDGIVFNQLDGSVYTPATPVTIKLSGHGREPADITINNEGQIDY